MGVPYQLENPHSVLPTSASYSVPHKKYGMIFNREDFSSFFLGMPSTLWCSKLISSVVRLAVNGYILI